MQNQANYYIKTSYYKEAKKCFAKDFSQPECQSQIEKYHERGEQDEDNRMRYYG